MDATKARARLGWRSYLTVQEALQWTVDWHKAVAAGAQALDVVQGQIRQYEELIADLARSNLRP